MNTTTLHKTTKKTLVPQLRFPEFEGEFHSKIFDEIVDITRLAGYEYSQYWREDNNGEIIALRGYNIGKGKLELIKLSYISNELSLALNRSRLYKGDIVYPCVGSIGNDVVIAENNKFHIQQNIAKISCKKDVSPYFIMQFLISDFGMNEVYRFNASGAQPNVLVGSLRKYKINIPSLAEQQKIASFLSAVDEKIQQLTRKKELLEQYKKGVMQQLFSGKLRFKDDKGKDFPEWEEKKLGEVSERVTRKNKENNLNVLTISAQLGLVSQLEYFNKSVSAKNVTNYYLLERNEFAYNKSYSNGYPMGAIKKLSKYDKGVVSTLYICFKFNQEVSLDFMEHYFEFGKQNNELEKVAQEGARDHGLLNIGVNDFFNIQLELPSIKEQQKIADFLSSIDVKIENVNQQLNQAQQFKKGLLQQMFV